MKLTIDYLRTACGAILILAGLTVQGLAWLLDRAGYPVPRTRGDEP